MAVEGSRPGFVSGCAMARPCGGATAAGLGCHRPSPARGGSWGQPSPSCGKADATRDYLQGKHETVTWRKGEDRP